ncbi:MAG: outer membrane protein assembly factor BamE [Alphaproteobacteria bacterium]|jgi:outer membrane protein assembly factor BamE (lipoprotein component of BamABCDE complex)|nr:outer membrane protein assembly factor BamE [Alphaproteobacteria bacterium]
MNHLKSILIVVLLVLVASCSTNLRTEGNYIFPDTLDKIKPGLSKEQVFAMLGATTIKANFNENTWYYIYEIYTRKLRFLNKTIIESKVVIINFDDNNRVKNVEVLNFNDRRRIPVVRTQTPNIIIKTNPRNSQFNEINTFSSN